jgi:hypothetical protein
MNKNMSDYEKEVLKNTWDALDFGTSQSNNVTMTKEELLQKLHRHVELTEECLDNFGLPNYVVELVTQDNELFNQVIIYLMKEE